MQKLESLWKKIDNCKICKSKGNKLQHIFGGGKTKNPEIMFVFINPTYRNITSKPNYIGPRYPFAGTKEVWKVFVNSGLLSEDLLEITNSEWNSKDVEKVLDNITRSDFYLTNIVKCTGCDGGLPSTKTIERSKPILFEEINIVKPKKIVAFGLLPFKTLTGKTIKLSEYLSGELKPTDSVDINKRKYPIYPCYFPVGRGNPKKAIDVLRKLK